MTSTAAESKIGGISSGIAKVILLILSCLVAYGTMVGPDLVQQTNRSIAVGDVSAQEILAPYSINFESDVLTNRAKSEAAAAVDPVFLPSDPTIAKAQLDVLGKALTYIGSVRVDELATPEQKVEDLSHLSAISPTEEQSQAILALSNEDWDKVTAETNRVLELVLRESIRNDGVVRARSNLPATIDFSLPSRLTDVVLNLVSPLVVPTSLYDNVLTDIARDHARGLVEPISRQIKAGEVLVRRGQVVSDLEFETLEAYNLAEPSDQTEMLIKTGVIVLLAGLSIALFYRQSANGNFASFKASFLVAVTFLIFLGLARFLIIDRTVLPYLYPLAAYGITIAVVFSGKMGILMAFLLALLTVYGQGREVELLVFYTLPTLAGILTIGKAKRIVSFLVTGLVVSLVAMGVVTAYRFADSLTDLVGFTSLIASAGFNGLASATVALLLQQVFAQVLDIPTALQLLDIARPDHPLMQMILRNAPGSYQHSLLVSNLAEQAAEAIGADRMLVRVGTLFHDTGKAGNPQYFIENQVKDKIDAHDTVDPVLAAQTIIAHVTDGVALAKRYHLPSRVIDFIREHHGTMVTKYQYSKALQQAANPEDVDRSLFQYPGPAPRSKETALLMLADGTEARARANSPKTDEEIRALVEDTIETVKKDGQLDNTDLSLRDLRVIADSFVETLKRSYHPRIKYPEIKPREVPTSSMPEAGVESELPANPHS